MPRNSYSDGLAEGVSSLGDSLSGALNKIQEQREKLQEDAKKRLDEQKLSLSTAENIVRLANTNPDSPYYKMLADSVAVPIMQKGGILQDEVKSLMEIVNANQDIQSKKDPLKERVSKEALAAIESGRGKVKQVSPHGATIDIAPTDEELTQELDRIRKTKEAATLPIDVALKEAKLAGKDKTVDPEKLELDKALKREELESKRLRNASRTQRLEEDVAPVPRGLTGLFGRGSEQKRKNLSALSKVYEGKDRAYVVKDLAKKVKTKQLSQTDAEELGAALFDTESE